MLLEKLSKKINANREYVQTVWADCSVNYEGRASGSTKSNHRLLLFKPDGNIQVIGPEKHKPVNWQPTGASLDTTYKNGTLYIKSHHPRTGDLLEICVTNAHSYNAVNTNSSSRCSLTDTENDYHNYIIENPDVIGLDENEQLTHELKTDVGRVDLYASDTDAVIEVKRNTATLDAVSQLNRYKNELSPSKAILVCPDITDSAKSLASDSGIIIKFFDL